MKGIYAILMMMAYVLGAIGGFGYSLYGGSWPVAIAIVILAYMAWPKFVSYWNILTKTEGKL